MTPLRVAIVQSGSCTQDRTENTNRLLGLVEEAASSGTDLVVLPELSTTPYFASVRDPRWYEWAEPRLGIVICYDRSFPELWQGLVALGATVILPVVSSLGWREDRFVDELRIRAFETQTWVIAANRGGVEQHAGISQSFFGSSCMIDPTGELVDKLPAHVQPAILRRTIDLDAVEAQRRLFPLARDKRNELFSFMTA